MDVALDSLLDGLNAALRDHIQPRSGLIDTLENRPSPPDHYGHVCAALALACAKEPDWPIGRQALQAWLALDERSLGHLPFNRLALLLLRTVLGTRGLTRADESWIETGLRRCTLRRLYPSNNWSLLAQTCRLIEAPPTRRARECRRMRALLERWTTTKGCFIDFPARPGKRFSTPLAYHHKALFLTALACWFHDDAELARHARRLLDWLVHCWDPAGYAGGFGRSTHSLFGDGCLIAALVLLGIDDDEHQPTTALVQRLARQRREDGFLWLNPAGHESGTASWDSYMHLSVYNAWAAAVIGVAQHLRNTQIMPSHVRDTTWTAARYGFFHDEEAGIAYWRTEQGLNALITTRGQPPQSYSKEEAEFRYAGGAVMHLRSGDSTPLLPPPLRVPGRVLLERPALAGWTPLLSTADSQYSLDEFDTWELRLMENSFKLTLAGQPRPLLRPTPRGLANQLLATVDWRILGGKLGRNAAIFRTPLRTVGGRIQIELTIDCQGAVVVNRCLDIHSQDRIQLLNPQGPARPQNSRHPRSLSHDSRHEAANDFSADTRNTTSFPPAPCIIEAGKPYTSSSCFQVVAIDPAQEET